MKNKRKGFCRMPIHKPFSLTNRQKEELVWTCIVVVVALFIHGVICYTDILPWG